MYKVSSQFLSVARCLLEDVFDFFLQISDMHLYPVDLTIAISILLHSELTVSHKLGQHCTHIWIWMNAGTLMTSHQDEWKK